MKITAENRQNLVNELQSIRFFINEAPATIFADKMVKFENQQTLDELEACLQNTPVEALDDAIKSILAQRWERIRTSNAAYTMQPLNPVTVFCHDLAKILSPLPNTVRDIDDLPMGEGPYFLLMPSLKTHIDLAQDNIHNLRLGEFILANGEEAYIPIATCMQAALDSVDGVYRHQASAIDKYNELSPEELARVTRHSEQAQAFANAIKTYNDVRFDTSHGGINAFAVKLSGLIDGLRAGGAYALRDKSDAERLAAGAGVEYDAGSAANVGILEFSLYWDSLTPAERDMLCAELHDPHPLRDLRTQLDLMFRAYEQNNEKAYEDPRYCVNNAADNFTAIKTRHIDKQQRITTAKERARQAGQAFTSASKSPEFRPHVIVNNSPQIIPVLLRYNDNERWAQFMDILASSSLKVLLNYIVHYEITALPAWLNTQDVESIQEIIETPLTLTLISGQLSEQLAAPALVIAATKPNNTAAVAALLGAGANIKATASNGSNALHFASYFGHINTVELLLEQGAEPDAKGSGGLTALGFAVREGRGDIVDLLLARDDIDVTIRSTDEANANILDMAISTRPELVERIVLAAARLRPEQQTEFLSKVEGGRYDNVLHYVLEKHPPLADALLERLVALHGRVALMHLFNVKNEQKETILILAAKTGKAQLVHTLLQHEVYAEAIDRTKKNALHWASSEGHFAAAEHLLQVRADINRVDAAGKTALVMAIENNNHAIAGVLLERRADLCVRDQAGFTAFDYAHTKESPHLDKLLYDSLALPVEQQKECLRTIEGGPYDNALLYAFDKKEADFIQQMMSNLLDNKITVASLDSIMSSKNARGESVIELAIRHGVPALLSRPDLIPPEQQAAALRAACSIGDLSAVERLLQNPDLPVDDADSKGVTALQAAILGNHADIAFLLLQHGASLTHTNADGNNVLRLAGAYCPRVYEHLVRQYMYLSPEQQQALVGEENNVLLHVVASYNSKLFRSLLPDILTLLNDEDTPASLVQHYISAKNTDGRSLLFKAVERREIGLVVNLLKAGADIHTVDNGGKNLLWPAITYTDSDMVRLLLANNILSDGSITPHESLNHAMQNKAAGIAKQLLKVGAHIHFRSEGNGKNALDWAIERKSPLLDRMLLQAIMLPGPEQTESLRLIKRGRYVTVLMYAIEERPELVPALLDYLEHPDTAPALRDFCIRSKNNESVDAMQMACASGNMPVVTRLLALDKEHTGSLGAFHLACKQGHVDMMKLFIAQAVPVNKPDSSGHTALYYALLFQGANIVKWLLEHGAAINEHDLGKMNLDMFHTIATLEPEEHKQLMSKIHSGRYPNILWYYVGQNLFSYLSSSVANTFEPFINTKNAQGESLLVYCFKHNYAANNIALLIVMGADIHEKGRNNENLLQIAAAHRYRYLDSVYLSRLRAQLQPGIPVSTAAVSPPGHPVNIPAHFYNEAVNAKARTIDDLVNLFGEARRSHLQRENAHLQACFNFDEHIAPMTVKLVEMRGKAPNNRKYYNAIYHANVLLETLHQEKLRFLLSNDSLEIKKARFQTNSRSAINMAKPELQKHREVGKLVAGFLLMLLTFPVSLPVYGLGRLAGFFKPGTDSAQRIGKLERKVNAIPVNTGR